LDAGADKNTTNESKRTALHICAYHGHEAAVRLLLLRGADSTALDEFDDSPLDDATAGGHLSIMRLLLERGERYSIDGTEKVLKKLAENGQNAALKTILDFQKDLLGTKILENCFHSALRRNNVDLVSILLEYDADANPASVVRYHGSAIHECAYYGNIKMARVLLDHPNVVKSTMVNSLTSRFSTPLIAAVAWDYERLSLDPRKQTFTRIVNRRVTKQRKMVKFLIEQGGDPRIRGSRYGTMLNAAAAKGQPELVEFVLDEVGLDIKEVDDEGRSPAHVACSLLNVLNTTDTLELLSKRAGVSSLWTTDKYGRLPIHFACGGQRLDILDYLLAEKTTKDRINESDHDGWTPLHWACRQWDVLLIRCLVAKHGAKTDCRTNDGWTPWDVAVFHDNLDFASALERYDPNPDADAAVTKGGEQWNADCDSCLVSQSSTTMFPYAWIECCGLTVISV
jgi:ankyrin repeat protein